MVLFCLQQGSLSSNIPKPVAIFKPPLSQSNVSLLDPFSFEFHYGELYMWRVSLSSQDHARVHLARLGVTLLWPNQQLLQAATGVVYV